MQRNTSGQRISIFVFVASSGLPAPGDAANLTAYVSIDDGTVTALADTSATEQSASHAPGYYLVDVAQAECDGVKLLFTAVSSTSGNVAIAVPAVIYTDPPNYTLISVDSSGRLLLQPAQAGVTIPTVTNLTNLPSVPTDWLTGAGVNASAVTKIQAGLATPTNITAGTITTVTTVTGGATSSAVASLQTTANTINAGVVSLGSPMQAGSSVTLSGDFTSTMKTSLNSSTPTVPTAAAIAAATRDVSNTSPATGSLGAAVNSAASAGDPWATAVPGAYSAGQAGFILGTNLNATVISRMATYTQPSGFLAATFPGTVASPTNITAGTITTTTNLTNLPSVPTDWLTAAGVNASAVTKIQTGLATPTNITAGTITTTTSVTNPVLLSAGTGSGQLDFTGGVVKASLVQILGTALTETAGFLAAGFKKFFNISSPTSTMNEITLVDTVTNSTNAPSGGDFTSTMKTSLATASGAPQTGDAFALIGTGGSNLTSLGDARLAHLDLNVSSRMATFALPNHFAALNITGTGQISEVVLVDTTITVTNQVQLNLGQALTAPRNMTSVADVGMTLSDGFWAAIGGSVGQRVADGGALTYTIMTCQGTTLAVRTMDRATNPSSLT